MILSQKLSGIAKTFRSALLTRWRGFCDSVEGFVMEMLKLSGTSLLTFEWRDQYIGILIWSRLSLYSDEIEQLFSSFICHNVLIYGVRLMAKMKQLFFIFILILFLYLFFYILFFISNDFLLDKSYKNTRHWPWFGEDDFLQKQTISWTIGIHSNLILKYFSSFIHVWFLHVHTIR